MKKKFFSVFITLSYLLTLFSPFQTIAYADETEESTWNFDFTGEVEEFVVPYTGVYKIDVHGASGGGATYNRGGMGGQAFGEINLYAGDTLYVSVGEEGKINGNKTYNGGGSATNGAGAGGGASFVARENLGELVNYKNNQDSLLLVAGGGGGQGKNQKNLLDRIGYIYVRTFYEVGVSAGYYPHFFLSEGSFAYEPHAYALVDYDSWYDCLYDPENCLYIQPDYIYKYNRGIIGSGTGESELNNLVANQQFVIGYQAVKDNTATIHDTYADAKVGGFGTGQSATNGYGAGGGGLYGGGASHNGSFLKCDGTQVGGNGGTGYIDVDAFNSGSIGSNEVKHIGDGNVTINFLGTPDVKTTIILSGNGTFDGQGDGEYKYEFISHPGDVIDFPDAVSTNPSAIFKNYDLVNGDIEINDNIATIGWMDSVLFVNWDSEVVLSLEKNDSGDVTISLSDVSSIDKYYKYFRSVDEEEFMPVSQKGNDVDTTKVLTAQTFNYTGGVQTYVFPEGYMGQYKIEVWGAKGEDGHARSSGYRGGYGGYTYGVLTNYGEYEKLYIVCGGLPYNGGGGNQMRGGGATHVATEFRGNGLLSSYNSYRNEILMVAGGGGGAGGVNYSNLGIDARRHGGAGGGGNNNGGAIQVNRAIITGGTQATGGSWNGVHVYGEIGANHPGGFGQGGNCETWDSDGWGSGGGGWYGGGGGSGATGLAGSGGSGHINDAVLTDFGGSNGQNGGNGRATITPIGSPEYGVATSEITIPLVDKKAPNKIAKLNFDRKVDSVYLAWKNPGDNGSNNKFYVEDYNLSTKEKINQSSIVETNYVSGVSRYAYIINSSTETEITKTNINSAIYINESNLNVTDYMGRYIHVAPIDNSGNIGETTHEYIPTFAAVTCIDTDIVTGEQIGMSTTPLFTDGYNVVAGNFLVGTTASAACWGEDTDLDAYYEGYFYAKDSATSITVAKNKNIVYRYFYPDDIYTDLVEVSGTNIYKAPDKEKTYYVKTNVPFTLKTNGYALASPSSFRVNNVGLTLTSILGDDFIDIKVPNEEISTDHFNSRTGELVDFISVTGERSEDLTHLEFKQVQSINDDFDGVTVKVKPSASLYYQNKLHPVLVTTENNVANTDEEHSIFLIGDAEKPEIYGDPVFDPESNDFDPLIDEPKKIIIEYADHERDAKPFGDGHGSGVKLGNIKVTLIQEQTDNGGAPLVRTFTNNTDTIAKVVQYDDYSGHIEINADANLYKDMSGFITIRVEITDNVGNTSTKDFRILVMELDAKLTNVTNGTRNGTNIFACGEFGLVEVETNGFIDQVFIEFPVELDELSALETSSSEISNEDAQYAPIVWETGRVLSYVYPHTKTGDVNRVLDSMQTKLWGSTHLGGMEWFDVEYAPCLLKHYFYAPLYANKGEYSVKITASKLDSKTGNIYTVEKTVTFFIGMTPDGDFLGNIQGEFRDTIKDN